MVPGRADGRGGADQSARDKDVRPRGLWRVVFEKPKRRPKPGARSRRKTRPGLRVLAKRGGTRKHLCTFPLPATRDEIKARLDKADQALANLGISNQERLLLLTEIREQATRESHPTRHIGRDLAHRLLRRRQRNDTDDVDDNVDDEDDGSG